ncbi:hypothetical protein ACMHYJ_13990 [Castellaniella hirudinis]|uniref:hypothetical protein n=1 Tax=Castellaniella hirudinis TaxID=1144617 RepID=UPI0039C443D7
MLHNLNAKKTLILSLTAIVLVLAFKAFSQAPALWAEHLPNPDSYTKLVLVRDWQASTGYQYMARDGGPSGSYLHWSAVHTWAMQQLTWGLQGLGLSRDKALLLAGGGLTLSSLMLLYLFGILAILRQGGRLAALATLLALMTSQGLNAYGQLVQITHHIFMLVPLAAAAWLILGQASAQQPSLGKTSRTQNTRAIIRPTLLAGLCLGLSLWISPETMPLITGLVALQTSLRLQYPDGSRCWPMALGLCALLLAGWLTDPPPPTFSPWALDHLSLAWLGWGGVLALLLCLADQLATWPGQTLISRAGWISLAALIGGGLWLTLTPGALNGPAGLLPTELQTLWWNHINELRPAGKPSEILAWVAMPLLAGILLLRQSIKIRCLWWGVLALTALAYAGLAAWHMRMGAAAALTGALAWGVWLSKKAAFHQQNPGNLPVHTQHQAALLLMAPVLIMLLSILSAAIEKNWDRPNDAPQACKLADIADSLNALPPTTVLISLNDGPRLQWFTHHRTLAGNYHHNTQGILNVYHIWRAQDDDTQARTLVKQQHIGALLVCANAQAKGTRLAARLARGEAPNWVQTPKTIDGWYWYPVL